MKETFPASWYPLCRSSELKTRRVLRREAFGIVLAVFRTRSGCPAAVHAQCSHMGADLSYGRVVGERLRCHLHEWEFGVEGRCEHIPATADIPKRAKLAWLLCREQYGIVFAFLGGAPTFGLPRFDESDHHLYSQSFSMEFDAPYQVLAANSFDSQHFSTVHHRTLLAPPTLESCSPNHFSVHFRARVEGGHFHDRLLRLVGVDFVDLSAHCWGGNNILAYNARTDARILFTILPINSEKTRVYILNVIAKRTLPGLPSPLRLLVLTIMHRLTIAFLKADVAVMQDLKFKLGTLLPEADHVFIEWLKYWRALPLVSALTIAETEEA